MSPTSCLFWEHLVCVFVSECQTARWVEAKGIMRWGEGAKGIKNGRLWETGQEQWASGL
jgi:hypothetical protein